MAQRPLNVFLLKAARQKFEGIAVGDTVRMSWTYDRAYGPGRDEIDGEIIKLDDWIRIKGKWSTVEMPITMVEDIKKIAT